MKLLTSGRIEKIKELLYVAGKEIDSKKKLQKLAYLCQISGEDLSQNFTFHHYGVFSPTLASDLDKAESMGIIKTVSQPNGAVSTELCEEPKNTDILKNPGYKLVNQLKSESTPFLEALTTIVYLSKAGYSGKVLKEKFLNLKEHLKEYFEDSLNSAIGYKLIPAK